MVGFCSGRRRLEKLFLLLLLREERFSRRWQQDARIYTLSGELGKLDSIWDEMSRCCGQVLVNLPSRLVAAAGSVLAVLLDPNPDNHLDKNEGQSLFTRGSFRSWEERNDVFEVCKGVLH